MQSASGEYDRLNPIGGDADTRHVIHDSEPAKSMSMLFSSYDVDETEFQYSQEPLCRPVEEFS